MGGIKYSIPNNYVVMNYNGLKGILRRDKKGDKWLWEPTYKHLIVSKTFGKILVAYLSAISQDDFLKICSYKGDLALQAKVYDVMFGENCLYVKTVRPSTNELEWCKVNEDFKGGTFLGNFEILSRNKAMPFHIPVGTDYVIVDINGVQKKLMIHTGEFEELKVNKPVVKPPEEIINDYNIFVNPDTKTVQLLHSEKNTILKQSTAVGEVEVYTEIIKAMMGGFEKVPKARAEKLITFLSEFEHYGNAIALPVLLEYTKARVSGDVETILDSMIKELQTGWKEIGNGYSAKVYTSGSIILSLIKSKDNKITVAPYMINGEDGILEVNEVEALVGCYKSTGVKTARLEIKESTLDETITDEEETSNWPSPYSIRQRPSMASDVKDFKYRKVDVFFVKTNVIGKDAKNYGDVGFSIGICDSFTYRSKKKIGGKIGDWITTNTYFAQVI